MLLSQGVKLSCFLALGMHASSAWLLLESWQCWKLGRANRRLLENAPLKLGRCLSPGAFSGTEVAVSSGYKLFASGGIRQTSSWTAVATERGMVVGVPISSS
ncbi:hypothetical protein LIA77_07248 [Sarocladium implicatum]|nr:hypothetical protein LIA77_07248 [Sarocladium implicatum]